MSDSQSPAPAGQPDAARRRDRLHGLVIVAGAFVLCLAVSVWARNRSRPESSAPPGPPTLKGIRGWPAAVDPLTTLPGARALTRRPLLRGIVMEGVRSDGTLDLGEGPATVRYAFQSAPGEGAQPQRDPGTLPKRLTCGKQNVLIRKEGLVAERDIADSSCPPGGIEPLPDPKCSLHEIWHHAHRRRAPKDRLAHIEYYRSKVGPAWRFTIPGTSYSFSLYGDCKRELRGPEALGGVP